MSVYVPRPTIDSALAAAVQSGAGVYSLEGPSGAGKSASLLHGLLAETERRGPAARGYVRLVQLFGDEQPSLFARRLVREATHLHLVSYPQPERLRGLIEVMAGAVPGLGAAGKLLGALVPDDLRPLSRVARDALFEVGQRAVSTPDGGPLVLGVDLLGGDPGSGVRDFFARLIDDLPPTVVLLIAQPGGGRRVVTVPPSQRIAVGALSPAEVREYLRDLIGAQSLEPAVEQALTGGELSLLVGDLAQLRNLLRPGTAGAGIAGVLELLRRDVAGRYQAQYEHEVERAGGDPLACDLAAWVAVAARPEQPLLAQDALRRLGLYGYSGTLADSGETSTLWRLRRSDLVQSICATVVPVPGAAAAGAGDLDVGWPLLPRHAQARQGVLRALRRHGLLDLYQRRWLDELWESLRKTPGPAGLQAGVQALGLLCEWMERGVELPVLGQAVALLGEMELPLWRAGWHRTFAELYDAVRAYLEVAGLRPQDAAPQLSFRRARARLQGVDWSGQEAGAELPLALDELLDLRGVSEVRVLEARSALGLVTDAAQVERYCRHLPYKARQARAYAYVLGAQGGVAEHLGLDASGALDEILLALSHFAGGDDHENLAQTLTILADLYSARAAAGGTAGAADELALLHYQRAVAVAEGMAVPPAFCLGVVWRSLGKHHQRRGRVPEAAAAFTEARRWLLRSPDAAMGTLLARLTPG